MIQISAERVALDLARPSAEQLDKLIQRLLLLRAQIDPPIPQRLPQDGNAIAQHQPAMELSRDAGGNIDLTALCMLADSALATATRSQIAAGARLATLHLQMQFTGLPATDDAQAVAQPLAVVEGDTEKEAVAEPLRVAPEEPVCELDADTVNVAVTVVEGVVKAVFVAVCVPVMLPTPDTDTVADTDTDTAPDTDTNTDPPPRCVRGWAGRQPRWSRIHPASAGLERRPSATLIMTAYKDSCSTRRERPLISRNTSRAARAMRLFPSRDGWSCARWRP
jgi:acyl-coenzyme A thioesterase PaaI-like protein